PKVRECPNRDAIIGYVGQAQIGERMTDGWLYDYIGRNLGAGSFEELAGALAADLDAALEAGDIDFTLVIHLGGFEQDEEGTWWPRVWYLHNTAGLTPEGAYIGSDEFTSREE